MSRPLFVKKAGAWVMAEQSYVQKNGARSARLWYVKQDGMWKHKHDFIDYELVTSGNCCNQEKHSYNCPCGCKGDTQLGDIRPDNHIGNVELSSDLSLTSTCNTPGRDVFIWNCCGAYDSSEERPLDPDNHEALSYSGRVEPTCTDAGQEVTEWCDACGYRSGGDPIEPLGHDFATGVYYNYVDELCHSDIEVCTRCQAEGVSYLDDHTNDPNNPGYCLYCGGICKT